ncbi:hypothetical protein ACPFUY_001537 [Vibrio cholerae]
MNVLQISTYPIVKPLHGGQIRVKEIQNELKKLGHKVRSISFSEFSHKYFDEDLDFTISDALLREVIKTPYSNDLATALASVNNIEMERFLERHLSSFEPDFIFIEQAWLWPLVKKILSKGKIKDKKVIYSSHNIEYLTKQSIFSSNGIVDECNVVNKIKDLEGDLCSHAYAVVGCTQADLHEFIELGAKKVILCPNGVADQKVEQNVSQMIKELVGERKYALFVGSAYPPNAQGFWSMLGNSMAWLKPDEMILAVGGCSLILEDFAPEESKIFDFVNFDKIKRLGFVESDELSALIFNAAQIILPITSGGGSNLKTAEAIIANKPVVATEMACRGYDNIKELSNFFICNTQTEFINAVQRAFSTESKEITQTEKLFRETVLWRNTLSGLKDIFN